jgi:hypothetical protein
MRKAILLMICSLFAFTARAAHYSDTYVIPIVGHVQGANGTMWMSDVAWSSCSSNPDSTSSTTSFLW